MNFRNFLIAGMALATAASKNQPVQVDASITVTDAPPEESNIPTLFNTPTDKRFLREEIDIQCATAKLGHDAVTDCSVLEMGNFRVLLDAENSGVLKISEKFGVQNIKSKTQKTDKTGTYNVIQSQSNTGDDALYILSEDGRLVVRTTEPAADGKPARRVIIQPCPVGEENTCHVMIYIDEYDLSKEENKLRKDAVELAEGRTLTAKTKQEEDRQLADAQLTELTMRILFDTETAKAIGANNLVGRARLVVELFNKIAKNSGIDDKVVMVLQDAGPANYKGEYDSYNSLMKHSQSDRGGADISMFVSFDLSSCGRAFLRCSAVSDQAFGSCPYGVLKYSCLEYSFAHETGHILGAMHNKEEYSPQTIYPDSYGILAKKGPDGARSQLSYAYDNEPRKDIFSVGEDAPKFEGFKMGNKYANNARVIALEAPLLKERLKGIVGTRQPTRRPTQATSEMPTNKPTSQPSDKPTKNPTKNPTQKPTIAATKVDFCPSSIVLNENNLNPIAQELFATPTLESKNSFSFAVNSKQTGPAFVRLVLEREFGGPIDLAFGQNNLMPNSDTVAYKKINIDNGDTFEVKYTNAQQAIITIRNSAGQPKRAFALDSNGFEYSGYAKIASANIQQLDNITCDYTGIQAKPITESPTANSLPTSANPVFTADIKLAVSSTPQTVAVSYNKKIEPILWLKISSKDGKDVSYLGFSSEYGLVTKQRDDIVTSSISVEHLNTLLAPQDDIYDLNQAIKEILSGASRVQITQNTGPGKTLRIGVKNSQTGVSKTLILRGVKPGATVEFGVDEKSKVSYKTEQMPTQSPTAAPLKYSTFSKYVTNIILRDSSLAYNYQSLLRADLINAWQYMPDIYAQMFAAENQENKPIRDLVDNKLTKESEAKYKTLNDLIQQTIDNSAAFKWFGAKPNQFNADKDLFKQYMANMLKTVLLAKSERNLDKIVLNLFTAQQDNSAEFLEALKSDKVLTALLATDIKTLTEPLAKEHFVQEMAVRFNKLFVCATKYSLNVEQQAADLDRIGREEDKPVPEQTSGASRAATFFAFDLAKAALNAVDTVVFGDKPKNPKP